MKKKSKKSGPRKSAMAMHVARRNVNRTPMKHRLEPKQGAKNDQPELLQEIIHGDDECSCEFHETEVITTFCPIHEKSPISEDDEDESDL